MKTGHFLFILMLAGLAVPHSAAAEERPRLAVKLSEQEVSGNPAVIEAKQKWAALTAEEQALKAKEQELGGSLSDAKTAFIRKNGSPEGLTKEAYAKWWNKYSETQGDLEEESKKISDQHSKMRTAVAQAAGRVKVALWAARIADDDYLISQVDSYIYAANKPGGSSDIRVTLVGADEKIYSLVTPFSIDVFAHDPACQPATTYGKIWAIRQPEPFGQEANSIQVKSFSQIFVLEEPGDFPENCPFGKVVTQETP